MNQYDEILAYFEEIAVARFGHTETERHYFAHGLEQFKDSQKSAIKSDFLVMDGYDFKYVDNGMNVTKERTLAFYILRKIKDPSAYAAITTAFTELELSGDALLNYLYNESVRIKRKNINGDWLALWLKQFSFNNVQVTPVLRLFDDYYGFFYTIITSTNYDISYDNIPN